ncbi:MAG: efflux RND transporter periplasmic adaptor subunit [Thermoguttaceae bacterium]
MKRPARWIALAVGLIAVLAWLAARWLSPGARVAVVAVQRGRIAAWVDERAVTRLRQSWLITTPSAGRVEAVTRPEGTPVKKGEVVARFVPLDVDLAVKEAQAAVERIKAAVAESADLGVEQVALKQSRQFVNSTGSGVKALAEQVKAAEARAAFANSNFDRVSKLAAKGAQTQEDVDQARLEKDQADAAYRQAVFTHTAMVTLQAAANLMPELVEKYILRRQLGKQVLQQQLAEALVRLDQAKRQQELGLMQSPIDGIVLHRYTKDEGFYPAGTRLLEIGDLDDLEIEADLLSVDVAQVKPGYEVEVYGPAVGPVPARARVDRIYPAGFTKLSSLGVEQQRVKVIIRLEPAELKRLRAERGLAVGYRVRVRIFSPARQDALIVPRSALFRGPEGTWRVFVVRRGRARIQQVALDVTNDDFAEVTQGLEEGDRVVLAPESTLADGQRVRPELAPAPPQTATTPPVEDRGD